MYFWQYCFTMKISGIYIFMLSYCFNPSLEVHYSSLAGSLTGATTLGQVEHRNNSNLCFPASKPLGQRPGCWMEFVVIPKKTRFST